MPDRDVKTIRDLLYYQYAKIIARSAFSVSDGKTAKKDHYSFIKETFRDLKSGRKTWSEITREDWQLIESEKKYLKTIYNCHRCAITLDRGDLNGDGEISVLDIDF